MAIRVPDITSRIQVDTTGVDKASKTVDKSTKRMSGAFGKLAAAGAGIAIAGFLKGAVDEAREAAKVSRLTEAALKSTGGVAKVTAEDISELAGALSNKIGVDDEAIQSSANLLLTFTKVRNEAGKGNDIFDQTVTLGQDMAAVMGGDARTSMLQLGKALQDPIKGMSTLSRAGVQFTEDQKAQIKTLIDTGDQLGAQKIILAELETQFGGAAEAAADPMARLSVTVGNLKEEVGTALLPTIESVTGALADMDPKVGANVIKYGALSVAAGGTVIAIGKVVDGAGRTVDALKGAGKSVGGFVDKIKASRASGETFGTMLTKGITPALGIAGVALAAGVTALFLWKRQKDLATAAAKEYQAAIEADSGAIAENTKKAAAQRLEDAKAIENARILGISERDLADAILRRGDAAQRVEQIIDEAAEAGRKAGLSITDSQFEAEAAAVDLDRALRQETAAMDAAKDAAGRVERVSAAMGESQSRAAVKVLALADAVSTLSDRFDAAERRAFSVEEATDAFRGAMDDLRASVKESGTSLSANTDKGRANRDMMRDLVAKANDLTEATFEQTGSVDAANAAAKKQRDRLREVAEDLGFNKDKVDKYAGSIRNVPKRWKTRLTADTSEAEANLSRVAGWIERINSEGVTTRVPAAVERGGAGGRASGGPVLKGRTYMVGEHGRELFTPATTGHITPAHQTTRNASVSVVNNFYGQQASPQATAEAIQRKARAATMAVAGAS